MGEGLLPVKLLTFKYQDTTYWGVLKEDGIYYSDHLIQFFPNMGSIIENFHHLNLEQDLTKFVKLDEVEILPPYRPNKTSCVLGRTILNMPWK